MPPASPRAEARRRAGARVTPREHTRHVPRTTAAPVRTAPVRRAERAADAVVVPVPAGVHEPVREAADGRPAGGAAVDLLSRLRAPGRPRPVVDAGLAGGLRAWLEDAVAPWVRDAPHDRVRYVTGAALAGATGQGADSDMTAARDAIARALFCLVVFGHEVRHPLDDALAVLSVDERGATVVDRLRHARPAKRATLRRDAALFAGAIAEQWRPPPPVWLPRVGDRLRVPLAGGRIVLAARADLALGAPAERTASVCMVHVQAEPGDGDQRVRRFLALSETLRSGAPPLRVATYCARTGELCGEEVSDDLLTLAVEDVATALETRDAPAAGTRGAVTGGANR